MAETGLWNIGGINLPDFGISEALGGLGGLIPNNTAITNKGGMVFNAGYTDPTTGQQRNTVGDYLSGTQSTAIPTGNGTQVNISQPKPATPPDSQFVQLQKNGTIWRFKSSTTRSV